MVKLLSAVAHEVKFRIYLRNRVFKRKNGVFRTKWGENRAKKRIPYILTELFWGYSLQDLQKESKLWKFQIP